MGLVGRAGRALLSVAALASLSACLFSPDKTPFEYLPNMAHSVPYDSFASNPIFADQKTLRPPPAGTVPRGFSPFPYGPGVEEAERAGRSLESPLVATPAVLERGRELYETFCWVCHGDDGGGDGPLTSRFPIPPAYTSAGVRDLPAGRLYHTITWGAGRMPGYRFQIPAAARWPLVHYVQLLQRGEGAAP